MKSSAAILSLHVVPVVSGGLMHQNAVPEIIRWTQFLSLFFLQCRVSRLSTEKYICCSIRSVVSDKFIHIVLIHCCGDPFIAVRLSDRAFVDNCEVKSALIMKPSHSDKWYKVPHGIGIHPFVSTVFPDFRCVKLSVDESGSVVTGNVR